MKNFYFPFMHISQCFFRFLDILRTKIQVMRISEWCIQCQKIQMIFECKNDMYIGNLDIFEQKMLEYLNFRAKKLVILNHLEKKKRF